MTSGIGEELREARLAQGRSLEDIAAATRARVEQLRAIEDERFEVFPGHVYARGFLRNYALAVGVDPEPLVLRYREHHQGRDELADEILTTVASPMRAPREVPSWAGWAAAVVLVAGGVVWLGLGSGGRAPEAVLPQDVVAAPPLPTEIEETPSTVEPPAPEAVVDGVRLVLSFEQNCWMSVEVDGVQVASGITGAGETLEYRGRAEIVVKYGNAGGVFQQVNGEDVGVPGAGGEVVTVRYTREGAERL
jgi:cytoskeleton protein RodZ